MKPLRRAVIVSSRNTLIKKTGAAEYLIGIVKSLRSVGFSVSILFGEQMPSYMLRFRLVKDYRHHFDTYRMFKAIEFGGYLYSIDIRHWAEAFLRKIHKKKIVKTHALKFDLPSQEGKNWARRIIHKIDPGIIVANYFNAADFLDDAPANSKRVILVHDILALRAKSFAEAGAEVDFDLSMIEHEIAAFAKADICLTIKEQETDYVRAKAPAVKVVTLPVTAQVSNADIEKPRRPICIFVGADNSANRDGLSWFLRDVWPRVIAARPEAGLHIIGAVGNSAGGEALKGVVVKGFVDDLDAAYAEASVAVTPLLFGSGVKIKLIEGLAAGLPSVATSVGAEGVLIPPSGVIRVENSAEGFAGAIEAFFSAPNASSLRKEAREFVQRHYDQGSVGSALITQLMAE